MQAGRPGSVPLVTLSAAEVKARVKARSLKGPQFYRGRAAHESREAADSSLLRVSSAMFHVQSPHSNASMLSSPHRCRSRDCVSRNAGGGPQWAKRALYV